jgi:uncharacterized membrane protein
MDPWPTIRFLHVVAMAFFLGGQLLLAVAVVPVERRDPEPQRLQAIARRFGTGSLAALAVLVLTGAAMASHYGLWGDATLQLKLGLVAVVLVLVALHLRRPRAHALQAVIFVLTLAIVWVGLSLAH